MVPILKIGVLCTHEFKSHLILLITRTTWYMKLGSIIIKNFKQRILFIIVSILTTMSVTIANSDHILLLILDTIHISKMSVDNYYIFDVIWTSFHEYDLNLDVDDINIYNKNDYYFPSLEINTTFERSKQVTYAISSNILLTVTYCTISVYTIYTYYRDLLL